VGNATASRPRLAWPAWRPGRAAQDGALGIAISADGVRAVRLRGADVEWSTEQVITEGRQLDVVLDEVLAETVRTWRRLRAVTVAVGPSCTQVRRLTRLPPVPARMLEALIQENASRFFLRNGVPVVTTSVARNDDGSVWAGAVEQPVVMSVADACARHRLRLIGVVPSVAVLHHALTNDSITWFDGEFAALVQYESGRIVTYRRVSADPVGERTDPAATGLKPELRKLPGAGWRFADAYGAARGGPRPMLAWHPTAASALAYPWRNKRLLASGFACALALTVAAVAPGVASILDEHRSRRALAALGAAADEAAVAERQYAVANSQLLELRRLSEEGRPVTPTLASITQALSAPAMLTSIQFDSAGGTLTALAPSASSVLRQLDGVHTVTDLAIVGPVVPEAGSADGAPPSVGSPDFPRTVRVTIRYKWRHAQRGVAR
jgi:hypothetical protein